MTWSEIKKAVEDANIKDTDEISVIECELHDGDKTFHAVKLGKALKVVENSSEQSRDAKGCAV